VLIIFQPSYQQHPSLKKVGDIVFDKMITVDTTEEDLRKVTERRKKAEEKRAIDSKIRSKNFYRDENLPELEVGKQYKLVIIELNALNRGGNSEIYKEQVELNFLVQKVYVHPKEPENRRVWYGGIDYYDKGREVKFKGKKIISNGRWLIFPKAHLLSVGKSLNKDSEIQSVELNTDSVEL